MREWIREYPARSELAKSEESFDELFSLVDRNSSKVELDDKIQDIMTYLWKIWDVNIINRFLDREYELVNRDWRFDAGKRLQLKQIIWEIRKEFPKTKLDGYWIYDESKSFDKIPQIIQIWFISRNPPVEWLTNAEKINIYERHHVSYRNTWKSRIFWKTLDKEHLDKLSWISNINWNWILNDWDNWKCTLKFWKFSESYNVSYNNWELQLTDAKTNEVVAWLLINNMLLRKSRWEVRMEINSYNKKIVIFFNISWMNFR
ncbi:MAG: hypothetical protein ACD_3C00238G0004 [uncultured bacterium (gcode 4)]|uniref:Uncharacterized protein n=1 Tax=uncultured bacterium (gcode 4) TaxID=1234023 RepID=K2F7U9_9BACT|nr:MAG: hypothetical protein ACD_3C00238G0004 [uncultured bacterium (gcode 4)]